jgi:photosystem II stability/assembly factor-like uncharacterized protein
MYKPYGAISVKRLFMATLLLILASCSNHYSAQIVSFWTPNHVQQISNSKEYSYIASISAKDGWKLVYHPLGMFHQGVELLRTEDNGKTWIKIAEAPAKGEGAIQVGGDKTGVSFLNLQTGWMTAIIPKEDDIWLYQTKDGGVTWAKQPLDIPSEFHHSEFRPMPPVFFSPHNGLLIPNPASSDSTLTPHSLLYVTTDGGEHWSPLVDQLKGQNDSLGWDLSLEYHWSVTYQNKTWVSADGGRSWNAQ